MDREHPVSLILLYWWVLLVWLICMMSSSHGFMFDSQKRHLKNFGHLLQTIVGARNRKPDNQHQSFTTSCDISGFSSFSFISFIHSSHSSHSSSPSITFRHHGVKKTRACNNHKRAQDEKDFWGENRISFFPTKNCCRCLKFSSWWSRVRILRNFRELKKGGTVWCTWREVANWKVVGSNPGDDKKMFFAWNLR